MINVGLAQACPNNNSMKAVEVRVVVLVVLVLWLGTCT